MTVEDRPQATEPRHRSWLEVRWRQWRNPPPPVVRAVYANVLVAITGAALLLGYALANRGTGSATAGVPAYLVALYVAAVIVAGSAVTYLWVELPTGARGVRRRSGWAALLGLFAAVPIAYLALVVLFQLVLPAIG